VYLFFIILLFYQIFVIYYERILYFFSFFFFFNDTAPTEIYTLSLHDALPIWFFASAIFCERTPRSGISRSRRAIRSEEHTSELQSRQYLVCRLLLEKKNK